VNEVFRVSRFEAPLDAKCLIEVDDYVPLRFRTYERPLGASYLRVGDQTKSLVELLIDPNRGLLRGMTVTWFSALSAWPRMEIREVALGLPLLAVPWGKSNRIDSGVDFSVSVHGSDILVSWAALERCDASCFQDRVRFLVVEGHLVGVHFSGLGSDQIRAFLSHAP
jgi:hypothetical protein